MSNLSVIRNGLKTVVEAYYSGFDFVVYPYEPDGVLEYPCLVCHPTEDLDYQTGPSGTSDVRFRLQATLHLYIQDSVELETEMDKYRSPTGTESLRAAVNSDDTLNGSVTYAEVVRSGQAQRGADAGQEKFWEFSSQFEIDIIKNIA